MVQPIKVLIAKPGMDGHWRGVLVVSRALRDAGMEVVYGGNLTPKEIAEATAQEDVDVVGLSVLCAGHLRLIGDTLEALKNKALGDRLVVVGGIIPREDIPVLKEMGVAEVFLPGTELEKIVDYIKNHASV